MIFYYINRIRLNNHKSNDIYRNIVDIFDMGAANNSFSFRVTLGY